MSQRWILHLDMDAFFAAVEELDDPSLRGKPVIIGGEERGVVSAASYEARKYGVRSAMPSAQARKLCPHGVFLPGRHRRYAEVSALVMAALPAFSPLVEQASVDEAYLDVTGLEHLHGPPEELGRRVKEAVRQATGGLTCSVGIAPVKFLAKIASDWNKPDGLFVLPPAEVDAFMETLPLGRIPGVGGKGEARLRALGLRTGGDARRLSAAFFRREFGVWGDVLWQRIHGQDPRPVAPWGEAKSEGAEITLDRDTLDRDFLRAMLWRQCERVGRRLRKHGHAGRTVTLKLKDREFRGRTRSRTVAEPLSSTEGVFEVASDLLAKEKLGTPIRLIGVSVSGFEHPPRQLSLLEMEKEDAERKRLQLDATLDAIESKFGRGAVRRGRGEIGDGATGKGEA